MPLVTSLTSLGAFDYAHLRAPLPKGHVPYAEAEEEERERQYIKTLETTSPDETAGNIWVPPEQALGLAEEYQITPGSRPFSILPRLPSLAARRRIPQRTSAPLPNVEETSARASKEAEAKIESLVILQSVEEEPSKAGAEDDEESAAQEEEAGEKKSSEKTRRKKKSADLGKIHLLTAGEPPSKEETLKMLAEAKRCPVTNGDVESKKSKRKAQDISVSDEADEKEEEKEKDAEQPDERRTKKARTEVEIRKERVRQRALVGISAAVAVGDGESKDITGGAEPPESILFHYPAAGYVRLHRAGSNGISNGQEPPEKVPTTDTILVFDINQAAAEKLVAEAQSTEAGGARIQVASSAFEATKDSDTIITVLPEPSHVKKVYSSILEQSLPQRDRLFIDCSTIDPSSSQEVAGWLKKSGQGRFADAPMSGGVVGATAGTLTFMLGADDNLVARLEPILLRMGRRVLHCGAQGTGLSAKLANNYLLAINNIATAEAMNLGMRWGLDPKTLANVINVSTGKCWPSEINNPKDLKLAILAAEEAGARLELGGRAKEVYEATEKDEKCAGRDFSVVYRYIGGKEV
ncbi:unnamed protein product [Parascedosporium putredinis]|uniref:3-hydroxyisobutyrate dehydrogenase n=1 Tax=Parascedosporium putredinis TaxID=1442378 RepID=A0A9P1GUP4_9PEZI|nr:unnamed protein product [Parascedosporium putredinis]CAI7987979.1 unnamed protein product [Parascedosporium putredinis]